MSAELQAHRWSDKPVAAKQIIFLVLFGVLTTVLVFRFKAKLQKQDNVHALNPGNHTQSKNQTEQEMSKSGLMSTLIPSGRNHSHGRGTNTQAANGRALGAILERALFDGMTAVFEAELDQSISSASGDPSVEAVINSVLPGEAFASDASEMGGAKIIGQFQANFESKRMQLQFRELQTPDGRHYAISGVANDVAGEANGVPADYSSGLGLRILGATLGTAISTAEIVATSRVIENSAGQDALVSSQLNQAITSSAQGATATLSDEATRDLKNQRSVLTLQSGTRFRIKIRQTVRNQAGG